MKAGLGSLLVISFLCFQVFAEEFTGMVVKVTDGHTIVVRNGDKEVPVRLAGIESPEIGEPFGEQAMKGTSGLSMGEFGFGKNVTVKLVG